MVKFRFVARKNVLPRASMNGSVKKSKARKLVLRLASLLAQKLDPAADAHGVLFILRCIQART
jgi:hypothetical protein